MRKGSTMFRSVTHHIASVAIGAASMAALVACSSSDTKTTSSATSTATASSSGGGAGQGGAGQGGSGQGGMGQGGHGGGAPKACSTMMFDKYGAAAFLKVRDSIVTKALAAPVDKIGPSFQALAMKPPADVDAFKQNLADFLVMVYGGPNNYKGADMKTAHKGLAITADQYDYFIGQVVVPALIENGVESNDIATCFAAPVTDAAFKASIVGQ